MWARNEPIGNFDDEIDFAASLRFLERFLSHSGDRFESRLSRSSKYEVYDALYRRAFAEKAISKDVPVRLVGIRQFRERFHLDSVGMSAFSETCNVLLIDGIDGAQRIIWKNFSDSIIREARLAPGLFDHVATEFLLWGKEQIRLLGSCLGESDS